MNFPLISRAIKQGAVLTVSQNEIGIYAKLMFINEFTMLEVDPEQELLSAMTSLDKTLQTEAEQTADQFMLEHYLTKNTK